jgi:hypothetical protein
MNAGKIWENLNTSNIISDEELVYALSFYTNLLSSIREAGSDFNCTLSELNTRKNILLDISRHRQKKMFDNTVKV